MIMTKDEIIKDYRAAKAPQNQIGVLADLNCCTKREIVNLLLEAGEHVPGNFLNKGRKKQDVPVETAPVADPMTDKRPRAQKPAPMMTSTEYADVLWWLAYGAGACISIEDEKVRENIVRCFETAHKLMKELTA